MRRATLVPCLRVSWAGEGHTRPIGAAQRPGGRGCWSGRCPRERPVPCPRQRPVPSAGEPARVDPPSRLPAGVTAFRGLSGDHRHRATRLQPNVARVATALLQSTDHQYSNLAVRVVRRGATGEGPTEGSGLSRGGNTGGTRSSEEVRRPTRPPDGGFSEGTDDRAGAPFAPLSGPCPAAPARFDVPT